MKKKSKKQAKAKHLMNTLSNQEIEQKKQSEAEKILKEKKIDDIVKNKYATSQQTSEAIQVLSSAITIMQEIKNDFTAKLFSQKGSFYIKTEHFQLALNDFDTAIRISTQIDQKRDNMKKSRSQDYYSQRGECYHKLNQPKEAIKDFNEAIKLAPKNGQFYLNRAQVFLRAGKQYYKHAIKDYDECLKNLNLEKKKDTKRFKKLRFQALLHRGICKRKIKIIQKDGMDLDEVKELKTNFLNESIDDLKMASELERDCPEVYNNLGLSYFNKNWFRQAVDSFKVAIDQSPQNPEYMSNLGLSLYRQGAQLNDKELLNSSLELYKKCIKLNSNQHKVYFNCGNVYLAKAKLKNSIDKDLHFGEAHKMFQKAMNNCSMEGKEYRSKIYHSRGLAYQDQDMEKLATEMFRRSLELTPSHTASKYHMGLMLHKQSLLDEAVQYFSEVLEEIGNDRLVLQKRGLVLQDLGRHRKAIDDFHASLKIQSNNSLVYYYRGMSRIEIGELDEAISDFKVAMLYGEANNPAVLNGIGKAYRYGKSYEKSLYYLNKALEINGTHPKFLLERSQLFIQQKRFKSAINDTTLAITKSDAEDPNLYYIRGLANYLCFHYKTCIKDLRIALKKGISKEYYGNIFYHIGVSFANIEKYHRAIEPLTKAIEQSKSDIRYFHERAKCYILVELYEQALSDFNKVLKKQPENQHALYGRAFAYKNMEFFSEAASDWERAKEIDPENAKLVINYRHVYEVNFIELVRPGLEQK